MFALGDKEPWYWKSIQHRDLRALRERFMVRKSKSSSVYKVTPTPNSKQWATISKDGVDRAKLYLYYAESSNEIMGNCGLRSLGVMYVYYYPPKSDFSGERASAPLTAELDKVLTGKDLIPILDRCFNTGMYAGYLMNDSLVKVSDNLSSYRTIDFLKLIAKEKFGKLFPAPLMRNPRYVTIDQHLIQSFFWVPPKSEQYLVKSPSVLSFNDVIKDPAQVAHDLAMPNVKICADNFYKDLPELKVA